MHKPPKIHLGVYGIYERNEKILLIKKNRGPYTGLYDLPGGSIEFNETINAALKREMKEETGADLLNASFLTNEEYQCSYMKEGEKKDFHHIGIYYVVDLVIDTLLEESDGQDSDGAIFLPKQQLSKESVSPIGYQALQKYFKNEF